MAGKGGKISPATEFKPGQTGNPNGRPKGSGSAKRNKALLSLLKDLAQVVDTLTEREKALAYQLYDAVKADASLNSVSSSLNHLYFIESEFGVKVGVSKDVTKRAKAISRYASNCKVIKVINNAGKFESDIHRRFYYLNIKGNTTIGTEWFFKNDDLLSFIEEITTIDDLHLHFNPKGCGQLKMF
jgi:hypothetical protein